MKPYRSWLRDTGTRTRGRRWMRLKHVVLVEEPVCRVCGRRPSVQVDHIIPISKEGTDIRENLQGICGPCHEEKTRRDLGIKDALRQIGIDGYPIKEPVQDSQGTMDGERQPRSIVG